MEAEARYVWVGALVLALLAALVGGLVWLSDTGRKGDYNRYAIHFQHQPLEGLEVGAEVTLRGIKVGRVEDYALFGEMLDRVRVEVRVDRRAPLRTSTEAVVTRNFVTGIAAITLVSGDPPGELLVAIPEGERYPIIREGRTDFEEITGRVNKLGDAASVALNNINQLLSADNRNTVMATVRSLRDLASGINQRLSTLDDALKRIDSLAGAIGTAVPGFAATAQTLGAAASQVGAAVAEV
ncbi:MAG: MlaD family protein, partial [Burkholderiaceae bacterium]